MTYASATKKCERHLEPIPGFRLTTGSSPEAPGRSVRRLITILLGAVLALAVAACPQTSGLDALLELHGKRLFVEKHGSSSRKRDSGEFWRLC